MQDSHPLPDCSPPSVPEDWMTSHLLVLVGGNPLPNAVAALLLTPDGGEVTLLHTARTSDAAKYLERFLQDRGRTAILPTPIHESRPNSIVPGVLAALDGRNRTGLHYTGGTKAMAVHAHTAARQWAEGAGRSLVATYLDARTLRLMRDPQSPETGETSGEAYIALACPLRLEHIAALQGLSVLPDGRRDPILLPVAEALANATGSNPEAWKHWKGWITDELEAKGYRRGRSEWNGEGALAKVELPWPDDPTLSGVVSAMRTTLQLEDTPMLPLSAAKRCGVFVKHKHFCEWLHGKWLEEWTLHAFQSVQEAACLHDVAVSVEPTGLASFEFDVAAMRGYQLYGASCSTGTAKGLLKNKLFEAAVRVRQMGGDEACTALVCCSENPDGIAAEVETLLRQGPRIRVFGRKHLPNLAGHLEQWINSQIGVA